MKKWWLSVAMSLVVFAGLRPGVSRAEPAPPERNLGNEVREIFATKCTSCHGADLVKPKGRFGYVLDLRRVASNPEMVIPERPTESELWVLVQRDEMPPPGSPRGTLTPAQKEVIREWIVAGAPEATLPVVQSEPTGGSALEIASADRILRFLGKFHLLLLHFPLALVLAAGFGEALSVWRRDSIPSESVRFCLWVGALAAIPTVGLGWLHASAGNGVGAPQILMAHRWLGTTAAAWLVMTAIFAERDARRGSRSLRVRLLLVSGVLVTTITAHFGGLLTHGRDFFNY
jgi:uncharacterized membrane protein/mono/diheme cytochrome c family protein